MLSHTSLRLFIFLKWFCFLFFKVVISIALSIDLLVIILTLEFPFGFCFIVSRNSLSEHSRRPCFPLILWIWSQKLLWGLPNIWATWSQFLLTGFFLQIWVTFSQYFCWLTTLDSVVLRIVGVPFVDLGFALFWIVGFLL